MATHGAQYKRSMRQWRSGVIGKAYQLASKMAKIINIEMKKMALAKMKKMEQ
jgi:hypothetical protein